MDKPLLLTRQETAGLLGLAPQTLAKWAMTGKYLPVIKLGRTVRYRYADIAAFLERCATVANRKTNNVPKQEGDSND